MSLIKKQWFLLAIAGAAMIGYFLPEWGRALRHYDIFSVGIFLSFLATGLSLETRSILRQVRMLKAPIAALVSSLVLYPSIAWAAAVMMLPEEFVIGICIIGTAPVTVSSGTILTAVAGGNVPLSLLICILTNFLAILTIPVMLDILLSVGRHLDLPTFQMLGGLLVKVLLPLLLGQLMRPSLRSIIRRYGHQLSIFQSSIIILIIFNAVSSSVEKVELLGSSIISVAIFVICLHFVMLLFNHVIAGWIALDRPSRIAFTIHTSQKTLAVSYIIWAGYFAADYPAAFLPAIICQLTQMTVGTIVAEFYRSRRE